MLGFWHDRVGESYRSRTFSMITIGASDHGVLCVGEDGGVDGVTSLFCWGPAEADEVNMSPLMSPATHSTVVGQETLHRTLVPSISVRSQFESDIDGLVLVRISPKSSVAVQNEVDAHEREEIHAPGAVDIRVHEAAPSVGLSERNIWPEPLPARHSDDVGHAMAPMPV